MILEYKCNNCNQYFKLKFSATDRGELNFSTKNMEEKCKHCDTKQELILNEIIARSNSWVKYLYLIALVISVTAFVITYNSITSESLEIHFRRYSLVFGLIFVVPFAIAANLVSSENRAVKRFNQFYV